MTDIVARAREAREQLAAALALLQSPEAGDLIDTVAGPVAKAMGALHQLESSGGAKLKESAPKALEAVRGALAALQAGEPSGTADQALEAVAGSLGLVHGLAEEAKSEAPPAEAQPAAAQPEPAPAQPAPEPAPEQKAPAAEKPAPSPAQPALEKEAAPRPAPAAGLDKTQLAGDPAPAPPPGALDATLPTPTKPETLGPAASLDSTQASVRTPAASQPSAPEPQISQAAAAPKGNRSSKRAPAPQKGKPDDALEVEANLGAHSPTNFYKGLSGNDVVDDGGLFVATYEIPAMGTKLWVSVHMPGGYEFEGLAEVRWTRETGAGDAPPGFGCAFRDITDEARKLIYRYVRNREPLFHDDL